MSLSERRPQAAVSLNIANTGRIFCTNESTIAWTISLKTLRTTLLRHCSRFSLVRAWNMEQRRLLLLGYFQNELSIPVHFVFVSFSFQFVSDLMFFTYIIQATKTTNLRTCYCSTSRAHLYLRGLSCHV